MTRIEELLAELAQEAGATRRVLERVPEDQYGWRPHEKSYTAGTLALHVARLPGAISQLATTPFMDVTKSNDPRPQAASRAELLREFDDSLARARATLGAMDDASLGAPWRLVAGDRELLSITRGQLLRTILFNHVVHHRAQLTVYLRQLGVPVPGIYGPSADEQPSFA